MKGTVPHSDQPTTKAQNKQAQVTPAQQATFSGSSKAYTKAAFLGLAIASGILWPEGSRANTVPTVTTLTPEMQSSSEESSSQTGDHQATAPAQDEQWQPSLLRNLSGMHENSPRANSSSEPDVQSVKSPKSGLAELSESEFQTPVSGTHSLPSSQPSLNESQPNSPTADSQRAIFNDSPGSRAAQTKNAFPETTGTNQPYATPEVPGAIVIESELTDHSVSVVYRVNSGETLAQIARRHYVSVEEIIRANNLIDPNFIQANQNLRIPQRSSHRSVFQKPSSNHPNLLGNSLSANENLGVEESLSTESSSLGVDRSRLNTAVQPLEPSETLKSKTSKPIGNQLSRVQPYTLTPKNEAESQFSLSELGMIKASGSINRPTAIQAKTLVDRGETTHELVSSDVNLKSKSVAGKGESPSQLHTSRLRADVDRLRQEYQMQQQAQLVADTSQQQMSEEQSSEADLTPNTPHQPLLLRRINPEFNPQAYDRQKEIAGENHQPLPESISLPELSPSNGAASLRPEEKLEAERSGDESVVATAPIGSSAYDPLKHPALGRIVSPDIPPLPGPESYLPGGTMRFNGYIWPSRGILTSGYGWRWGRMHRGIDIAAPIGTPVVSAAPGVVTYAGWHSGGFGNLVEIEHPDGSLTLYAHNDRVLVSVGQKVPQGHQIAEMGTTGRSTGPHLHFEIHPAGQGAVNPMALLPSERENISQR